MKQAKYYLSLNHEEYRLLFHSLIRFRNKLISQGRYTDAVDKLLIKRCTIKRTLSKVEANPIVFPKYQRGHRAV